MGLENQHPFVPASLNDLNLPINPFNWLNTMVVIQPDKQNRPKSPEALNPSPISTPPTDLSIIEGWKTPRTTTEDATF